MKDHKNLYNINVKVFKNCLLTKKKKLIPDFDLS